MNCYINNLKSFLAEQTPNYGYKDATSILEMLCYHYVSENPVDNALIHCQMKKLDDILSQLPLKDNDTVSKLTFELCSTYERQAFLDGICVGMRLFTELADLCA